MEKIKKRLCRVAAGAMVLFFVWLALSWLEIGMRPPTEPARAHRYNAFVVLTAMGDDAPSGSATA